MKYCGNCTYSRSITGNGTIMCVHGETKDDLPFTKKEYNERYMLGVCHQYTGICSKWKRREYDTTPRKSQNSS